MKIPALAVEAGPGPSVLMVTTDGDDTSLLCLELYEAHELIYALQQAIKKTKV